MISTDSVCFPYLVEDMAVILMHCLSSPPKLKSGHCQFLKKDEQKLSGELVDISLYLTNHFAVTSEERIADGVNFLLNLGLATKSGMTSKSMSLVITELGHKWLNSTTDKQLETIYTGVIKAKSISRISYINNFKYATTPIPLMVCREEYCPVSDIINSFTMLSNTTGLNFDFFIREQVKSNNPLIKLAEKHGLSAITIGNTQFVRSKSELEFIWADYLKAFSFNRLFALGGLSLSFDDKGLLFVAINDAGRFLIGMCDTFTYSSSFENKVFIVQPDFDIIFIAPSPAVESKLSPFCDRVGSGIGVVFRISKRSIMNGASIGLTEEDVINTLEENSLQALSDNVRQEIVSWFGQCCIFEGAEVYIMKCPDNTTMLRILEIGGSEVTSISDTFIQLNNISRKVPFLKKLSANGIFLK